MSKYMLFIFLGIMFTGCATAKKCPSEDQESVSVCRAKSACGGAGRVAALFFGSMTGSGHAADDYNQCVDQNLEAQRSNASFRYGSSSTTITCKTEDTGYGVIRTRCSN